MNISVAESLEFQTNQLEDHSLSIFKMHGLKLYISSTFMFISTLIAITGEAMIVYYIQKYSPKEHSINKMISVDQVSNFSIIFWILSIKVIVLLVSSLQKNLKQVPIQNRVSLPYLKQSHFLLKFDLHFLTSCSQLHNMGFKNFNLKSFEGTLMSFFVVRWIIINVLFNILFIFFKVTQTCLRYFLLSNCHFNSCEKITTTKTVWTQFLLDFTNCSFVPQDETRSW